MFKGINSNSIIAKQNYMINFEFSLSYIYLIQSSMRTEIDYSWLKRKVALVFSSFLSATIMKFELNSCPSRAATPANHVKENIEFLGNRKEKDTISIEQIIGLNL